MTEASEHGAHVLPADLDPNMFDLICLVFKQPEEQATLYFHALLCTSRPITGLSGIPEFPYHSKIVASFLNSGNIPDLWCHSITPDRPQMSGVIPVGK